MRHMLAALCLLATPSIAQEVPRMAVDIAPINSLVVQMMQGGWACRPRLFPQGLLHTAMPCARQRRALYACRSGCLGRPCLDPLAGRAA